MNIKVILLLFICCYFVSFAQVKISGRVTTKKSEPLQSASIYIKDTYDGASTDNEGKFSFTTSESGEMILVASFIGYKTVEQKITIKKEDINVNLVLEDATSSIKTVVISAGTFEASDENKSVILRPLDIVTTGTTADIYSALNTLPGTNPVGEKEGLFVRGGSGAETKTIIDEMIVQKPFFSTVPDVASRGRFSPMLFKGTVFSSGGYSAQYGQALSSTLILKTQDLAPDTRSSINLMAVGFGGSHTQRWENTSLSAEGGYYNLAPYYKVQEQRLDWNSPPYSGEGMIIFRHKLSQTGMFKLHTNFNSGSLSLNMKNLDAPGIKDKYIMGDNNFLLNTSYSDICGGDWTFFTGFAYSRDWDDIEINNDKIKVLADLKQVKTTLSKKMFDGAFISTGIEYHNLFLEDKFNQYSRNLTDSYTATYAETDIFFSNDIAARAGIRYEYSSFIDISDLAPRLSFAYKLGTFDQLNFSYGKFYQTPEKDFLFVSKKLDYENASHYILNYQYLGDDITFRIEGYYKDYINLVKKNNDTLIGYDNTGKGYAKGIDLFLRCRGLMQNTDFWVSYSYLDTKRDYRDFPSMAVPDFAAEHTFSVVYKQFFTSINTFFGLTYTYSSGRTYYNPNNPVYMGDKTKNYNNLGINASYITNIFKQFTVVFFSIDNVFGFENVFSYRFSKDGKISEPVIAPAKRMFFIGAFISLGENNTGF